MTDQEQAAREKILERVRKLLALSTSPNEHEAARAAERAQAMLAEYNLSMSEVVTNERAEDEVLVDSGILGRALPWRHQIAQAIAKMYFCEYIFYNTFKNGNSVYVQQFVGAKHNIAVAKMMLLYLDVTIERLAQDGAKQVTAKEKSPYRTSFRNMCAYRVSQRMYDKVAEAKTKGLKTEGGTNLPALLNLYEKAESANKAFLEEKVPGLKITKTRIAVPHLKGHRDGNEAGNSIALDGQISNKAQGLL